MDDAKLFDSHVSLKYSICNALFLDLPFEGIKNTGITLPLFARACERGLKDGKTPEDIIAEFLSAQGLEEQVLFHFIQYIERQVLLFDALEDAAFEKIRSPITDSQLADLFQSSKHKNNFSLKLVLTAHPTQFYSQPVLGIREELIAAAKSNDLDKINQLLMQLGKTPFSNTTQPSPIDEAHHLIWYLKHVFFGLLSDVAQIATENTVDKKAMVKLGFWPGGDRDGNPYVTHETTVEVAKLLKHEIVRLYRRELKRLRKRLTFSSTLELLKLIDTRLKSGSYQTSVEFSAALTELLEVLDTQHQGLFRENLVRLIGAVKLFGFHFVTVDIRQNSKAHSDAITELSNGTALSEMTREILDTFRVISEVQDINGKESISRYIISNTQKDADILNVLDLAEYAGIQKFNCDIVPLFETIDDMRAAPEIMKRIFDNKRYHSHLQKRENTQTVMLGFSDGTKDGGYVSANVFIYNCKIALSELANSYGVAIHFFDGRGGPPARGGGKNFQFYRAQVGVMNQESIELTVQGQTITTSYGTKPSALLNIERLLSAGLSTEDSSYTASQRLLLTKLSDIANKSYRSLLNHDSLVPYLEDATPLNFLSQMKIASRPAKRIVADKLQLKDLRAIPFVASWSLMKQNIPGFFGMGTALKECMTKDGDDVWQALYQECLFFSSIIDNCMQSLAKTNLQLTHYLKDDPEFGNLFNIISDEYKLALSGVLRVTKLERLLDADKLAQRSIAQRESIILPLLVIQQFALSKHRKTKEQVYKKLIIRSIPANINASRNSA